MPDGINPLNAANRSTSTGSKEVPVSDGNSSMGISDFYKLLSAQLKYQDADNPMNTSEMMAQMVQTQMMEAITQMTAVSSTTYAASMVGKEVTVAEIDENGQYKGKTPGVVTGVMLGNNPIIFIGEKGYTLSQIMVIGKEPPEPEDDKDEGDKGEGDKKPDNTLPDSNA